MLPNALAIGVDYKLFWHLNPTKLKPFQEAYFIKRRGELKRDEEIAYINGIYVFKAIASCFSKNEKFPEKPIKFFDFEDNKKAELSEDEIVKQRENLVASLQLMQASFEANKISKERVP